MPTPTATTQTCRFGPIVVDYDARVLTPRAWTLAQSRWAAHLVRDRDPGTRLLELCAGAGHIGLAAAVWAELDLVQVESDRVAADYAAGNARRAGWGDRVEIRVAPVQTALRADEQFPVIIADPPYLPSSATGRWPQDPVLAIDGGADGLNLIRACLKVAAEHLSRGGCMLLQVAGSGQAAQVDRILQARPGWGLQAGELRTVDAERAVLRVDGA